ncbi:MAG: hypothetical protein PHP00_07980 [Thiotrichaceae bacterium]|nr:hypothetical protein [Thiotrichaceae bacterium]
MFLPKHPWLRYFTLVALWLPLTTGIWLFSKPVLLDTLYLSVNPIISHSFTQSKAHIEREGDTWVLGTVILQKEQPEDKSRRRYQYLKIGSVFQYTLEIPLLWAMLLGLAPTSWRSLLGGTLLVFGLIVLKVTVSTSLQTGELLISEAGSYVELLTDNYQQLHPFPTAGIIILKALHLILAVITLLSPVLVTYLLQIQAARALFIAGQPASQIHED